MAVRRARPGDGYGSKPLDAIDLAIVGELQADARTSLAELGRRVGLSPPAVADRVQRLEETGVITGYHAAVDPSALGFPLTVIVRVSPAVREIPRVAKIAIDIPEVVECHRITGEDCFVMKLCLRAIGDLEGILDLFTPFGRTTTSVVQSSPVTHRPLPLSRP
jgi:Lrp/AsnC family transcriptional regulator, leucine-responsive regulatory protein